MRDAPTDAELTRLLAEKVMGWPITRTLIEAGRRASEGQAQIWEVDEPGFMGKLVPRIVSGPDGEIWAPLERIDHAWMVLATIGESPDWRVRAGFQLDLGNIVGAGEWWKSGPLWPQGLFHLTPRAICLAALLAVGEEVE